jgi:ankyrin repeat protein
LELAVDTNADVVKLLIQKGADIKGKPGCFALLKAADAGRDAAVRVLLDAGAPVTFEWRGETPLMVAVRNGHPEAAKLLKERGATR